MLILVFANWGAPSASDKDLWTLIFSYKWYITGIFALMLCWSLIRILNLRPLWVGVGTVATIVSVFLADALIVNAKLVPLVPMVVGIASLPSSCCLINETRKIENGHCHHGDLPSRYYPCWPSA